MPTAPESAAAADPSQQRFSRGLTMALLRRVVAVCCVISIAGMIVTNVKGAIGGAMAFGTFGAVAMGVLIVANALERGANLGGAQSALAEELEARVRDLVASGADENALRDVVRKAHRLGQGD